jgi:hypothetical protein
MRPHDGDRIMAQAQMKAMSPVLGPGFASASVDRVRAAEP